MKARQANRPARRHALRAAVALGLAGVLAAPTAWAQKYPDKPIRLVVGYSAGGGVDAVARLLGTRLSTVLGQQVLVENRTGATGLIAADLVAKAAPDGYTLMMGDSALLIAKLLQPKIAIDPLTSFKPVAGAFISPLMIVTGNDFPAKTPAELVEGTQGASGPLFVRDLGRGHGAAPGLRDAQAVHRQLRGARAVPRRRADRARRDRRAGAHRRGQRHGRDGAGQGGQAARGGADEHREARRRGERRAAGRCAAGLRRGAAHLRAGAGWERPTRSSRSFRPR
jgi:hypothetical protein